MRVVSLTFDDALDCHLDVAVPLLERHGFRGTFFVPVGAESFTRRLDEWRAAAGRGHELGNHTMLHPAVRGKGYITEGNAIENYTLDRMRLELEAANRILAGLDGQASRTFAYPCCNSALGQPGLAKRLLRRLCLDRTRLMGWLQRYPWLDIGSSEQSYESLVDGIFPAARSGGERLCCGTGYPPRRAAVPCITLDGKTKEQVGVVLSALEQHERGWLVFMVHGVGGGHRLSVDLAVFAGLLGSLRDSAFSVLTFRDAAARIPMAGTHG
jgi:sialate O-acetylesterase